MITGIGKCIKTYSLNPDAKKQMKKILGANLFNKIQDGEDNILQYCKKYTKCSRSKCNNIEGTIYDKTKKLPYDYKLLDKCLKSKTKKNCTLETVAKSSKKGKELVDQLEQCRNVTCKDDYNNWFKKGEQLSPLYKKMFSKMKKYSDKMKKSIKK